MSEPHEAFDGFDAQPVTAEEGALMVQVDGFEGPLDLLLALARNQKVDIAKISILKLADQYLEFIEKAKKLNLDLNPIGGEELQKVVADIINTPAAATKRLASVLALIQPEKK